MGLISFTLHEEEMLSIKQVNCIAFSQHKWDIRGNNPLNYHLLAQERHTQITEV